jgi:hypothetical protein
MSASKTPAQQCPICRTLQPLEATRCHNCGAALDGVAVTTPMQARTVKRKRQPQPLLEAPPTAAWDEGETDLYEGSLPRLPMQGLLVIVCTLVVVTGIAYFIARQVAGSLLRPTSMPTLTVTTLKATEVPTFGAEGDNTPPPTNTRTAIAVVPTLALATVTPAPPTATITPTRGPCTQKANKGDTVYGMAARCGHRDLSIVPIILELNNMKDAGQLQIGQTLIIPWPTPTGGAPAQSGAATGTPGAVSPAEPTLPAGVTWYKVKKGDTAVSVAYTFHTDMKTLRDLNPEIQFSNCDFGQPGGGPDCTLKPILGEGQRVRVPAPTPTPTLSPTYTGSETATPTATPTFNAPFSQSPSDNMLFEASELPTLRWVASGELGPNDLYVVTVHDTATNVVHTAATRDLSFQLPADWQPTDGKRHTFEWSVAVASQGENGTPTPSAFTTETRTFTWQSR